MKSLTPTELNRLVQATEIFVEREAGSASPRRSSGAVVDEIRARPILSYLLAPHENGYWTFQAKWNNASGLAIYLLEKLGTLDGLGKEEELEIDGEEERVAFFPSSTARKLSEDKRQELLRVTNRLTSINALFRAALRASQGKDFPSSERDSWIKQIDLTELRTKYSKAFDIYKDRIFFEGMPIGLSQTNLSKIKAGMLLYMQIPKRNGGQIQVAAAIKADLCAIKEFYEALDLVNNSTVHRVFAPDEALFKPYFSFVSSVLPHIVHDDQSSKTFSQALDYYREEDFQHCISTLGLIAEDYLQRIYTSLMREQINGGLTLGQTIDRIHKRIDDLIPAPKTTRRDIDEAYEKIKNLDTDATAESIKPILREFAALIQDDRVFYSKKIDDLLRPPIRRTPFPNRITENLNELLKWRNAASHNSRVPLGAHEADRTLYCLVSIITWWQDQLASIDWSKTKTEILDMFLQNSKLK